MLQYRDNIGLQLFPLQPKNNAFYGKKSLSGMSYIYAILSLVIKIRVIIQVYICHELKIALILVNVSDHSCLLWWRREVF